MNSERTMECQGARQRKLLIAFTFIAEKVGTDFLGQG
jgi:hypothetical protein